MTTSQTLEVPGYQVVQYLGSGARSTIWQIRDSHNGKDFALKRVVKRSANEQRFLDQAINEYEVASGLDHPSIRHIYSMRKVKHWLSLREIHLIMEMCPGMTIQDQPPPDIQEVVKYFCMVADALAYMNGRGFVHSDMKPNNIILAPDCTVKVIDLGQSCTIGTVKARIQGTPDFIAPEQVHRRPLDARTDVYNFGATLYWTLTGKPIPTALPKKGALATISDMKVTPPEDINPLVTLSLSRLILDCIQTRPANRPESMNGVAKRLEMIALTLKDVKKT